MNVEEFRIIINAIIESSKETLLTEDGRQNGSISSNVAYTEDNIPVRTLYAAPIPHFFNEQDVESYFARFGTVENVNIYSNKHHKFSFITFNSCEDAVKCLRNTKHQLNRKKLRVSIADSWHQPKTTIPPPLNENQTEPEDGPTTSTASPSSPSSSTTDSKTSNEPSEPVNLDGYQLLYLNDDCLMHIFSFMDIHELVKIIDVCPRFREIITSTFKRYKNFDFKNVKENACLTLMESREILSNIGNHIQNIVVNSDKFNKAPHRLLELIPKFCQNLDGLSLEGFYIHDGTLKKFNFLFRKLKSLEIGSCGVDDSIEKHLCRATNLERLDISKNHDFRGSCFKELRNLKYLNIDRCVNLQPKFITDICNNNKDLQYLNINRLDRLNTNNVNEIVGNLKKLEHLVISNSYDCVTNFEDFGDLESLKKLQIVSINSNTIKTIGNLFSKLQDKNQIEHLELSSGNLNNQMLNILLSFDKLEELIINYNMEVSDDYIKKLGDKGLLRELHIAGNTNITDEGLLYFIDHSPRLELLDLSHCFGLTDLLIIGAIEILKKRKFQQKPVKFLIGGTLISETEIFDIAKLGANSKYVKVSFVKTSDPTSYIDGIDDDEYDCEDVESDYDFDEEDGYDMFNPFWKYGCGSSDDDDDLQDYYPWFC